MTKVNRSKLEMWDIFTEMDTRFRASDRTIGSMSSPFSSGPFQMGKWWVVNKRNMPLWRQNTACSKSRCLSFIRCTICCDQAMGNECWNYANYLQCRLMWLLWKAVLKFYLARHLEVLRGLWSCGRSRTNRGNWTPLKTFKASSCKDYDDNDRDMRRMMMMMMKSA